MNKRLVFTTLILVMLTAFVTSVAAVDPAGDELAFWGQAYIDASGDFYIDDGVGDSDYLYIADGDDNYISIYKADAGEAKIYNNEGALYFGASADADDGLALTVVSNLATLSTFGSGNLVITSGGGDVVLKLGDAAGANKVSITDSAAAEVAYIDSDGSLSLVGLTTSGALASTGTLDVDGSANISDTTAGADITAGNTTGNINLLSDNFDLGLTDAIDAVFKVTATGVGDLINYDGGATDTLTVGDPAVKFVLDSDTLDISSTGAITGATGISTTGALTDGALSSTAGTVTGVVALTASGTVQALTISDGSTTITGGNMSVFANRSINFDTGIGYINFVDSTATNTNARVIEIQSTTYAGGASDGLEWNLLQLPSTMAPTNAAGTDFIRALRIGSMTDPGATITSNGISIGAGWDAGILTTSPITDGTATWDATASTLAGFASLTATTVTDGTFSSTSGALSGVTTIGSSGTHTATGSLDMNIDPGEALTVDVTANTTETLDITATADSNDAAEINFTYVDDADATDAIAGLEINVTSAATADADTLYGLHVGNVTDQANLIEHGISVGTGWEQVFNSAGFTVTQAGVVYVADSLELGNASDTTLSRSGAGALYVEGVNVLMNGGALGTPASGTLTNCTGLPVGGITGFGANVATFLATPSSANLATAVATTTTGTGSLVMSNSPALVTPSLGAATADEVAASPTISDTTLLGCFRSIPASTNSHIYTYYAYPNHTGGATDTLAVVGYRANMSQAVTNAAGTDNVTGLFIDGITDPGGTINSTGISVGAGFDRGIDMGNNTLVNIGAAGTDFGSSGELTLASTLTATAVTTTSGGVELDNASDTTIARSGAGAITVEGVQVILSGAALGTPASGTLTNATGLPVSTGLTGLGANVATFLATPSSVNLAAAVTDETGSGLAVFATSPALTTPDIGDATGLGLTFDVGATRTITVATDNTAGDQFNIIGASGGTGDVAGGNIVQTAGTGGTGSTGAGHNGGNLELRGGPGGTDAGGAGTGGTGGDVWIFAGAAADSGANNGGKVKIQGGAATGAGNLGYVNIGTPTVGTITPTVNTLAVQGPSEFDGEVRVDGVLSTGSDFSYAGHKDGQVIVIPIMSFGDPDWVDTGLGPVLGANKGASNLYVAFPGLKVGEEIVSYKLVGDVHKEGGDTVTLDCKIQRLNSDVGPPTATDITGGGITQVAADGVVASTATLSSVETVADLKGYRFTITGQTSNVSTNEAIYVGSIHATVNRK